MNATKNCQKERIENNFSSYLNAPGKYSQASTQLLYPSAEEFNYTRRDRVKGALVNTPTFT
jgi:hypothetical protein